jgi:uncharacterized protein (TIRG00374 family)
MAKISKQKYQIIGILILIIILTQVDLSKLFYNLSQIDLTAFFLINLITLPVLFLKSLRWRCILQAQSIYYPVKDAFLVYLGGLYAGLATPGRIGEISKSLYLRYDRGVPLGKGAASVFIDRLCDLYLLLSLGLLGMWRFYFRINSRFFLLAIIALLACFPFILANKKIISVLTRRLFNIEFFKKYQGRLKFHYLEFYNALKKIDLLRALLFAGITLIIGLLYFWQCHHLFLLAQVEISFMLTIFFVSIINLAALLPIAFAGIGTREAALMYLFSLVNYRAEDAVAVSFLIFASFYLVTGIFSFFGWYIKIRQLSLINNERD